MEEYFDSRLLQSPSYKLIGHRGVKGLKPENTLSGFKFAKLLGLNWVELDVRLTKCRSWVVIHDATIDRTTNGTGHVIDKTLEELSQVKINKETIPTLKAVINLAASINLYLNIEIKLEPTLTLQPQYFAEIFAKFIKRHINTKNSRHLISSFNLEFLEYLRSLIPDIPIAYVVNEINNEIVKSALNNNFNALHCNNNNITQSNLSLVKNHSLPIFTFTINNKQLASKAFALGIDGIFTDRPDLINLEIQQKLQELAT